MKKAQTDELAEIEKKIEEAETPEELDELEKQLDALEKQSGDEAETADAVEADTVPAASDKETDEEEAVPENVSLKDVMQDIKDIKKEVSSNKDQVQQKLLHEIEDLNDQMGLNKIVDLNTTVDDG